MTGHSGHDGRLVTEPAPRAAHPPVQTVAEVVGRRPVDAYVELTFAAPEIAERAEPGQFVAFAVGGETSGLLLRRSIAISTADDGVVTIVVSLFTKPKPDAELKGLVYSLTPKAEVVETVWYKRPVVLAGAALVILIVLNIIFF